MYVLWLLQAFWRKQERLAWMSVLPITLTGQMALGRNERDSVGTCLAADDASTGCRNLLDPARTASADQLFATHYSRVPLFRKESAPLIGVLPSKPTDYINRRGGLSS